jgi:MFS family permease
MTPMKPPRGPDWLTRNLRIVSGVSFLQDAASELLYPILPIFLTTVLGAPAAVVGIVEGVAEAVASGTRLVAGRLADRYPRRRLIGTGYGLAALGKVLVAVAGGWPTVLAGRAVDRVGKGIRGTPRDALIAAEVPPEARGRAFGFHRTADTAGAVLGPLVGLAAYELLDHRIRPLLVIAVIPAVLSALLVLAIREPAVPVEAARPSTRPVQLPLPPGYWRVVVTLGCFALVNFPDALLLLRLHEIGFTVPAVIGAYVAYNAVYTLLGYPAGALADRLHPAAIVGAGLVFFAIAYAGLGLTRSQPVAWVLLAAYGAFTAATDGVGRAWISRLVPAGAQGRGQGVFQSVNGFGVLVAGLWAGLAWGADGRLPLLISGAAGAVLAVGLLGYGLTRDRHVPAPA